MNIIYTIIICLLLTVSAYAGSCQTGWTTGNTCNVTSDGSTPSCALGDVQDAINQVEIGDTVEIPAGTCTWGDGATYLSVNKDITVQGAGIGSTIITLSDTAPTSSTGTIRISAGGTVKSMTINQAAARAATCFSTSTTSGWRITDIYYQPTYLLNETFTGSADDWTLGAGWEYGANAVSKTSDGTATLSHPMTGLISSGRGFNLQLTITSYTTGTLLITLGGDTIGTALSGHATYTIEHTVDFDSVDSTGLIITPSNTARFTIDNINVSEDYNGYFLYVGNSAPYGLVDNNTIIGRHGTNELIFANGPTDSWQPANSIGGADNLFVENNTFSRRGYVCDINNNGRAVFRYNTISGSNKIDFHGRASNSVRGARHGEIYNNLFTKAAGGNTAIEFRGGGGRIYGNVSYNTDTDFYLTDYCYTSAAFSGCGGVCKCPTADYPVQDQIGNGKDGEAREPLYLWNNSEGGVLWSTATLSWKSTSTCVTECGYSFTLKDDCIVEGRDYFISDAEPEAMAAYSMYTCPHPDAGAGTCTSTAGKDGYILGGGVTTWTVSPTAPGNFSIAPAGNQTIEDGKTTYFDITRTYGYSISASGCGGSLGAESGMVSRYTTGAITGDCSVTVTATAHLGTLTTGLNNVTLSTGLNNVTLGN